MNNQNGVIGNNFPIRNTNGKTYRSNSLSIEEQERLLSVVETFEDLVLFKLALTTGIRREDIVNIEIGNVDLDNRVITFWESKKKRFWKVPIHKDVMPDLIRYMNSLPRGQKKLFTFTGRTAYNKLQKYLKKAGIKKDLSFHDLRRTFMKTAKKRGMDIKMVAQITGDSVKTVQDAYENYDMEELKEAIDAKM